jgi:hypothetical protein
MKINELIWQAAREYARQFGELLGVGPEFWVADQPWMCSFGDCYFFTLEEMAGVIDNLEELTIRWGTRSRIGDQIRDWVDWWLESDIKPCDHERMLARVTHQLRVNIKLSAWLDGCPREDSKPFDGPDAHYIQLQNEHETLERLISQYRENRTLGNVLENVSTQLDRAAKEKAERDFQYWSELMNSQAGQQFKNEVNPEPY